MPEMLTIVGASVRAAAQSAERAGFATLAADLFADVDLANPDPADPNRARRGSVVRVADYPAGFEQAILGPQPGGWLYTGGIENYPELVARWSRSRRLWGNDAGVLEAARIHGAWPPPCMPRDSRRQRLPARETR